MIHYLIYVTPLLFILSFEFYTKWQLDEMIKISQGKMTYANAPRKWHPYGALIRFMFFGGIVVEHFFPAYFEDILLSAVIYVILWDVLMNVIVLKVKPFYNGTTSSIDRLNNVKWYGYAGLLIIAIVFKIRRIIINIKNKHNEL